MLAGYSKVPSSFSQQSTLWGRCCYYPVTDSSRHRRCGSQWVWSPDWSPTNTHISVLTAWNNCVSVMWLPASWLVSTVRAAFCRITPYTQRRTEIQDAVKKLTSYVLGAPLGDFFGKFQLPLANSVSWPTHEWIAVLNLKNVHSTVGR